MSLIASFHPRETLALGLWSALGAVDSRLRSRYGPALDWAIPTLAPSSTDGVKLLLCFDRTSKASCGWNHHAYASVYLHIACAHVTSKLKVHALSERSCFKKRPMGPMRAGWFANTANVQVAPRQDHAKKGRDEDVPPTETIYGCLLDQAEAIPLSLLVAVVFSSSAPPIYNRLPSHKLVYSHSFRTTIWELVPSVSILALLTFRSNPN